MHRLIIFSNTSKRYFRRYCKQFSTVLWYKVIWILVSETTVDSRVLRQSRKSLQYFEETVISEVFLNKEANTISSRHCLLPTFNLLVHYPGRTCVALNVIHSSEINSSVNFTAKMNFSLAIKIIFHFFPWIMATIFCFYEGPTFW